MSEIIRNSKLPMYEVAKNYFNALKIDSTPEKSKMITEFEANTLFFQWFNKKDRENVSCMNEFLKKCTES